MAATETERAGQHLRIVQRAVTELLPYARNARTHSDAQVASIAASVREFGFTSPILCDGERGVIAGHGRLLAARQLGLTEVPTIELAHLTEAQRRAYRLADNKLTLNGEWDDGLLAIELGDLRDIDLVLTGFTSDELAHLTNGAETPDATPQLDGTFEYRIIVDCDNEAHQGRVLERLEADGLTCHALIS